MMVFHEKRLSNRHFSFQFCLQNKLQSEIKIFTQNSIALFFIIVPSLSVVQTQSLFNLTSSTKLPFSRPLALQTRAGCRLNLGRLTFKTVIIRLKYKRRRGFVCFNEGCQLRARVQLGGVRAD